MASMNKMWQQLRRSDNVQEYFMRGEFIQSDNWERSSPPNFSPNKYPYIKDCIEFYGKTYRKDIENKIQVMEITHGTSCENMIDVIKAGGFRPGKKFIPGIGDMHLIWFGLKIGETEIDCVKDECKWSAGDLGLSENTVDDVISYFASTAPFQPMSRYGNFKFTRGIQAVLREYKEQFCPRSCAWPEMRKFGTFAYKMETMHAILVCPPGTYSTDQFPYLSNDPIIQPDEHFGAWTWRPHSTGDKRVFVTRNGKIFRQDKRWEHVVFAFHVPEGECLKIANLNDYLSLCLWQHMDHEVSGVNAAINTMLERIAREKSLKRRKLLANILISMIRGYFDEMHLYEKTITSGLNKEDLSINQEFVSQQFKDLLRMRLTSLNWSPLPGWITLTD